MAGGGRWHRAWRRPREQARVRRFPALRSPLPHAEHCSGVLQLGGALSVCRLHLIKSRQQPATQPPPAPAADGEEAPQSPWQFAVAFAFVTVGAFLVGRSLRKHILQPSSSADLSTDGPPAPARRRPPSVQDLLRRHGGDGGPAAHERPASSDALLSSAAAETSRAAKAEVRAAAAARSAAGAAPAAAAAARSAAAAPAAAAAATAEAPAQAAAAPPTAAAAKSQAPVAAAAMAAATSQTAPPAAGQQQQQQPAAQQPALQEQPLAQQAATQQQQQQASAPAERQAGRLESWCESTLKPAVAAADAAAAAQAAAAAAAAAADLPAAPLLGLETAWVLCLQRPDGATPALRLAMPVPEGGEEMCLAVFQVRGGGALRVPPR